MSAPLMMTKLFIPSPGKYLVGRAHLLHKLNGCVEPGCRLTLISAPAGFGKTTLLSAWAAEQGTSDWKVAWLSIDEGDNDPVVFWTYIIAALQTRQPGIGERALPMQAVQGVDLEVKLALLINDLAQSPQPIVLVLDDYHLVRSPQIHQSLVFFLDHLPPHIHLVIASRTDPPLPLALLRGRGRLLEIRLNDLRFSDVDAEAYLNDGIGLNLAEASVQALNQKTEGWIAGLQMAALAMQDMSLPEQSAPTQSAPNQAAHEHAEPEQGAFSAEGFVASFSGSNRFILDYLIEEVLNRQPEPIQQFLIQTSILERLCGSLCSAILGEGAQPEAELVLRQLESSNLFLFPLDQQRYWYRYHQLFADLLRKRLMQSAPEIVRELHRRAVQWHEENGLIPSAIHHAFQMQDFSKAAALVSQITEMMWGRGEHATLLAWMDALPNAEKGAYPHLLTFQVSMLISAGKLKEAEACIPILEQYIAAALEANPDQPALLGSISELRTYIASFYNDRTAVFQNAQTALKYLTRDEDSGKRCGVSLVLGHAYLSAGNLEAATATFAEAVASGKKAGKPSMTLTGLSNLAVVLCLQGCLSRAAQICEEGRQLIEAHHLDRSPMAVDIRLAWGWVLCERGALDAAEPVILGGLEMALEQQFTWQAALGQQAIARLLLARGRLAEAESAAQDAEQWAAAHPVPPHITCRGAGLLAEIWLRQGKTEQTERYLLARQIPLDGEVQFPRQAEQLAWARLACLRGDAEAGKLLERVSAWAEANRHIGARIAALLLRALLSQSLGKREESVRFLGQAMEIAQSEGYVQCFADEGEPGAALLREAVKRDIQAAYAARLLTTFGALPAGSAAEPRGPEKREPDRAASSDFLPLVEPLSKREMETLLLIAEGLSNKEIAQKMCISLRTVKYYSTGLYNKLGVDSRMQAVNRARALGLI